MFLMIHITKGKEVLRMSREIIWSYAKWLIKTGRKDTIANFKIFHTGISTR